MPDTSEDRDELKPQADKATGKAQGGADSSGAGNILAGVQPEADDESSESERRDG